MHYLSSHSPEVVGFSWLSVYNLLHSISWHYKVPMSIPVAVSNICVYPSLRFGSFFSFCLNEACLQLKQARIDQAHEPCNPHDCVTWHAFTHCHLSCFQKFSPFNISLDIQLNQLLLGSSEVDLNYLSNKSDISSFHKELREPWIFKDSWSLTVCTWSSVH